MNEPKAGMTVRQLITALSDLPPDYYVSFTRDIGDRRCSAPVTAIVWDVAFPPMTAILTTT